MSAVLREARAWRGTGGARALAAAGLLAGAWGCATGGSPPEVTLDRMVVSAPAAERPLAGALFLAGCWRATEADGAVVEESWSLPAGGVMLGWSRTLRADAPAQFEQLRIEEVDGAARYRPAPGGRPSEHDFRLTAAAPNDLTFEAPEHDFPRRIRYRRLPDGTLSARIDGGAGSTESADWVYQPVDCP